MIAAAWNLLRNLWLHPLTRGHRLAALQRLLGWQWRSRLGMGERIVAFTARTQLAMRPGMTGATGNYYFGLHEWEDMAFVLHLLREHDLFLDIGANVGSYTVLAAGHCRADTIAVEPIPSTLELLRRNVDINGIDERVTTLGCGVADQVGQLRFSDDRDTTNRVIERDSSAGVLVPVTTIDRLVGVVPIMIKIDIEGFENPALAGAEDTLASSKLKAVLIELNASGESYGYHDTDAHETLSSAGFNPYRYEPFSRQLERLEGPNPNAGNTLYLRNISAISARLQSAPDIVLPWRTIAAPKSGSFGKRHARVR